MADGKIDEAVRRVRWHIGAAGASLRSARDKMDQVGAVREGYYPDWALDEMDDVLARLARLAARLSER